MDDQNDREYSRAPELEDLIALCASLNRESVRYILIGGFAVILHGFVRATKEIDLLIDPSEENVRAVKRAMSDLPDNAIDLIADDEVARYSVVRVADEIVVDLLATACGVSYADAEEAGIEFKEIGGVSVPIPSKELLIRMKDTVRESDAVDVRYLRLRISEEEE